MFNQTIYNNKTNIINKLVNEILYGGHFTALSSPSIILSVVILLDLKVTILNLFIAYLIPLIVYSYNYNKERDTDYLTNPEKYEYLGDRNKYYVVLYVLLLILSLIVLNNYNFILFVIILVIGGLLYSLVFKAFTRTIPGFKSIFVTLIWAYAGTFYMIYYEGLTFNLMFIFIFSFIYLKGFINVVYFDIKDIVTDRNNSLKTFPVLLGKKYTIIFLGIINFIASLLIIYFIYINVLPTYAISLLIFSGYTFIYLIKGLNAKKNDILKYTYIIVDAEFIFWPIVLFISKIIYLKTI